jgi:drug/metabolite transporter (DMT)-like permease
MLSKTTDTERRAHRRAIGMMIVAPLLWSIAGVVTRHLSPDLQANGRFEITFWRSFFTVAALTFYYVAVRREGLRPVFAVGRAGMVSGAMWAVMFTAFMLALTLTTTANTLLTMSVAPLLTALLAWVVLRTPIPGRTWIAIAAAMIGMAWMFLQDAGGGPKGNHLRGMALAFTIPMASAINLVTLQKSRAHVDLIPAVLIGGAISALAMLPLALPFRAAPMDIFLLAVLGVFQLAIPCALLVIATRHLSAPEAALLALLEVVLGPLWTWLGANETPSASTVFGGLIVLAALIGNEALGLRARIVGANARTTP